MRQLSRMMQMNIHLTIGWRRDEHGTHKHEHGSGGDSLICITRSLEDSRELKHRRFWATYVNRKWAFFSFNMLWRHQICIAKSLYYYRDDLPKSLFKITAQDAKSLLTVDVRRLKTSLLKLPNAFSVLHYVINVALHYYGCGHIWATNYS